MKRKTVNSPSEQKMKTLIKEVVKDSIVNLEAKTTKLETDVAVIKTDAKVFREEVNERFNAMDKKLDKIYTLVDGVAGEVKTYREQQELNSNKLSNHDDRIEKLEKHTGTSSTV